jgi:hypothetical protein
MPKLSKSQREQQWAEQRQRQEQARWAEFVPSYQKRLLNLVFEYSSRPELVAKRDQNSEAFVLSYSRNMSPKRFPMELVEYAPDLISHMEDAEWELQQLMEAERESNRLYLLRQTALNKLSAEERQALNL